MVNHQASLTGNYITLFRKLKSLKGIEDFTICTPLSYGSKYIRKNVLRLGKRDFGLKYVPLLKLFPVDEYNKFLDSIPVAIFGAASSGSCRKYYEIVEKWYKSISSGWKSIIILLSGKRIYYIFF